MAMHTNGPAKAAGRSGALAAMHGFDFTAWPAPIDTVAYRQFVAEAKADGQQPEVTNNSSRLRLWLGLLSMAFGAFALFIGAAWRSFLPQYLDVAVLVIGVLIAVFGVYVAVAALPRFVRRWRLFYRATRFAEANGLEFLVRAPTPDYDGMLFHMPSTENERDYVFTRQGSPLVEAGLMRHTYGSYRNPQKDPRTLWCGYLVVELPVSVQSRAVVRSNGKKNETAIPIAWARKLGPAVVLDDVFTLYGPAESSTTARQVFTPGVIAGMRALEAKFSPVSAELLGNHLYVFSRKPFDMYNPKIIRLVFDTIAAAQATSPGTA